MRFELPQMRSRSGDEERREEPDMKPVWVRTICAVASAFLAGLTTLRPDWLEVTGVDPDAHSGLVEWAIVAALFAIAVGLSMSAVRLARGAAG
jgi:hypothetical protein